MGRPGCLIASLITVIAGLLPAIQTPVTLAATPEHYGTDAMLRLDRLPWLFADISAVGQSSFDRSGGNGDAGQFLYSGSGENVMLDLKGAGTVYRIWTTGFNGTSTIKAYIDGEAEPRLSTTIDGLYAGTNAPFFSPLSTDKSSGGLVSHVPIPFKQSIKITTNGSTNRTYYNIGCHLYMPDADISSWTPSEDVTAARTAWQLIGHDPKPAVTATTANGTFDLAAGQTQTLLDVAGPRSIVSLRIKIPDLGSFATTTGGSARTILNGTYIRIYWDNETTPSVDAPIGSFFGMGLYGPYATHSLMVGVDSANYLYCFFPMPFAGHATVNLVDSMATGLSGVSYEIRHASFTDSFERIGYFKTRYSHENHNPNSDFFPVAPYTGNDSTDITWLDIKGSGKFCGVVSNMRGDGWRYYLEGDERIYVDNCRSPAIHGTGTEDFFNAGWYFKDGTFTQQMHGNPALSYDSTGKGTTTAYRFFLQDAVAFRTHLRASIEHGGTNDGPEETWTLAYYYLDPEPTAVLTDSVDIGNASSETAHSFAVDSLVSSGNLTSTYEGAFSTVSVTQAGKSSRGAASFTAAIQPLNNGVIVRRMFDQQNQTQQADVTVDGTAVGTWYKAGSNTTHRWREDEFMIPASLTRGKSQLHLALTHAPGTPVWSQYKYWVFCLTDTTAVAHSQKQQHPILPSICKGGCSLSIFGLDGKLVKKTEYSSAMKPATLEKELRTELPTGLYLFRLREIQGISHGKLVIR